MKKSGFHQRRSSAYLDDLFSSFSNLLASVPNDVTGGILCLFASQPAMTVAVNHWTSSGALDHLSQSRRVFLEGDSGANFEGDVLSFTNLAKKTCPVFFGYCRGKLGEGINLPLRMLFMFGVPNLSRDIPMQLARKEYLGEKFDAWCDREVQGVINQCIGRLLRGQSDFGAVYLMDQRFVYRVPYLPDWVQASYDVSTSVADSCRELFNFLGQFGNG